MYQKNNVKRYFYQKMSQEISSRKYPQKKIQNTVQNNVARKIYSQKYIRRKIYLPKIFEEKSLPKNRCREISTQNLRKIIIDQTNFEEIFLPIKIMTTKFTKKSLKRNHYQKISAEKSAPKISEE